MKPRTILPAIAAVLALWFVWQWFFCRFYVPPGHMAVIIAKEGKALPPGQILARKGQKGVQEEVLGEGRHFLNPIAFDHRIEPVVTIPPGKVGVVTSKVGDDLPQGEFLANAGQKGIRRGALGPGRYRLNPYAFQVDVQDAISIPIGYVGVVTSLAGDRAPEGAFAGPNQKGIREDILQPGLYYVNPKEFKIDVLEVGVNQVSMQGKTGGAVITKGQIQTQNRAIDELQFKVLENQAAQREEYVRQEANSTLGVGGSFYEKKDSDGSDRRRSGSWAAKESAADMATPQTAGRTPAAAPAKPADQAPSFVLNQFVEFPSRDGFDISLDMTVEFELQPDKIPKIFRDYGDLPAVVEKIIMPQILSISRLKGSAYRATDFIVGEGREKFQTDLTDSLKRSLAERNIAIHNALIRHVNVPAQILEPIQQASVAQEQDLTNQEKQKTARKQAELNTEQQLIEQRGAEVAQETAKLKAEIKAQQEKKVAEIQADTARAVAQVEKETALLRAEKARKLGRAQAESIQRVEGERARGFVLKTTALGDPMAYNLAEFARGLSNDIQIRILHAGPGTLWTDLENATLEQLGGAKAIQESQKPAR